MLTHLFVQTLDNLWPDGVCVSIEQLVSLIRKLQLMRVEAANQKRAALALNKNSQASNPIVIYCHVKACLNNPVANGQLFFPPFLKNF